MSKTEVLNNNIKRISNLALFLYVISFYIVFWTFSSSDTDLIFNTKNVELPLIDQGSLLVDINTFAVIAPIILVGLHLLILYLSRKQIKMMLTCRDEELNDLNHSLISSAFTENVRYKRIVYYLVRFIYFYIPFIVLIYVFRRFSDLHLLNLTGFHFILIVIDYSLIKILGRELR